MNFIFANFWKPWIKQQEVNLYLDGEPKGILRSFPLLISLAIIISSSCSLHSLSWPKYLITSSVYNPVSSAETETKKRHFLLFCVRGLFCPWTMAPGICIPQKEAMGGQAKERQWKKRIALVWNLQISGVSIWEETPSHNTYCVEEEWSKHEWYQYSFGINIWWNM